jgi:hypothetical protein
MAVDCVVVVDYESRILAVRLPDMLEGTAAPCGIRRIGSCGRRRKLGGPLRIRGCGAARSVIGKSCTVSLVML